MEISMKKLPQSRVEMKVSLPWEEWSKYIDEAVEHIAHEVKVPGFRPGRTPKAMLEKKVGKGMMLAEAAEHAIQHAYPEALEKEKIDAIGRPDVELESVKENEALVFSAKTDIVPEIELKDWRKSVKKTNETFAKKPFAVTEEEVTAEIDRLRDMRSELAPVDRPAQNDDVLEIDFDVFVDNVLIDGGSAKNHPIVLGKKTFIPGFEDALLGTKTGESKEFELSFPSEYHAKHLAGKQATFKVKVNAVKEKKLPELSDTFSASVGSFKTVQELTESVRKGLEEEGKEKLKEERRAAILDALVESSTVEFPVSLVEEEKKRMLSEFSRQVSMTGLEFSEYLKQMKKTEEELAKEWEPQAKKRLSAGLAIERVADENEIEIENDAVEAEMNQAFRYFKNVKDAEKNLDMQALYRSVRNRLRNEKAFELLEKM